MELDSEFELTTVPLRHELAPLWSISTRLEPASIVSPLYHRDECRVQYTRELGKADNLRR